MQQNNSKSNQAIIIADTAGYRVNRNGNVVYPDGSRKKGYSHNRREPNQYLKIFVKEAQTWIYVHRLAAYKKFGPDALTNQFYVGHKNLDGTDNRPANIVINNRSGRIRAKSRKPVPITEQEYKIAKEMHSKGFTSCDIAARLTRSPRSCRLIVERLTAQE